MQQSAGLVSLRLETLAAAAALRPPRSPPAPAALGQGRSPVTVWLALPHEAVSVTRDSGGGVLLHENHSPWEC